MRAYWIMDIYPITASGIELFKLIYLQRLKLRVKLIITP